MQEVYHYRYKEMCYFSIIPVMLIIANLIMVSYIDIFNIVCSILLLSLSIALLFFGLKKQKLEFNKQEFSFLNKQFYYADIEYVLFNEKNFTIKFRNKKPGEFRFKRNNFIDVSWEDIRARLQEYIKDEH